MKKRNGTRVGITVVALLGALGCAGEVESVGSAEAALLDVNVSLMQADEDDDPGNNTIIWDIVEAGYGDRDGTRWWEVVQHEPAAAAEEDDNPGNNTVIWDIVEAAADTDGATDEDPGNNTIIWDIVEAASQRTVCEVVDGVLYDSATGRALLEARGDDVYYPGARTPAYVFSGDEVLGADGSALLETDPEQQSASEGRKLIIAALVDGLCGSGGAR